MRDTHFDQSAAESQRDVRAPAEQGDDTPATIKFVGGDRFYQIYTIKNAVRKLRIRVHIADILLIRLIYDSYIRSHSLAHTNARYSTLRFGGLACGVSKWRNQKNIRPPRRF